MFVVLSDNVGSKWISEMSLCGELVFLILVLTDLLPIVNIVWSTPLSAKLASSSFFICETHRHAANNKACTPQTETHAHISE